MNTNHVPFMLTQQTCALMHNITFCQTLLGYYVWPTSPLFLPNKIAPQKTQNTVPRFIAKTPRPGHANPPCPSEFQEIEPKLSEEPRAKKRLAHQAGRPQIDVPRLASSPAN